MLNGANLRDECMYEEIFCINCEGFLMGEGVILGPVGIHVGRIRPSNFVLLTNIEVD